MEPRHLIRSARPTHNSPTMRIASLSFLLLCAPAVLPADVVEQGPKDAKPSGLLGGVARADITPPAGIAQLNWGSQTHVEAIGIDPAGFYATALVLSDGRQKFAMVDVDHLNVNALGEAVALAAERSGIRAAHIRIGATHTHSGPSFLTEKGPVGTDPARYERVLSAY